MTDILKNEDLYKFDARTKVILCYKYAFYTISTGILMYLNKVLRGNIRDSVVFPNLEISYSINAMIRKNKTNKLLNSSDLNYSIAKI